MAAVLERIVAGIDAALKWLIIILIGLMTVFVCFEIFMRGLFDQGFPWTEEVSRFLQVYVTIIGSSYAVKIGAHLGIDALTRLFSPFWKHVAALLVCVAIIAFSVVIMIVGGIKYINIQSYQTASAVPIKMLWIYLALPIAGVLNIIYCLEISARHVAEMIGRGEEGVD